MISLAGTTLSFPTVKTRERAFEEITPLIDAMENGHQRLQKNAPGSVSCKLARHNSVGVQSIKLLGITKQRSLRHVA
jgi:hypothetical protein